MTLRKYWLYASLLLAVWCVSVLVLGSWLNAA